MYIYIYIYMSLPPRRPSAVPETLLHLKSGVKCSEADLCGVHCSEVDL